MFRRRKRTVKRRRPRSNGVYAKFVLEGSSTITGGTPVSTANAISLTDMSSSGGTTSVTSYANLYQQYRIRKLKWNFYPRGVANTITWADDAPHGGTAVTAIDYDDTTPPTNFQQLARSAKARVHTLNRPFTRYFTPTVRTSVGVDTAATVSSSGIKFSPWLRTNALGIEHYGLKTYFRAPGAIETKYHMDYLVTAYVQFRFPQ